MLKDIPEVSGFQGHGGHKYIVAQLTEGDEKKTVVRLLLMPDIDPADWPEHRSIGRTLCAEVQSGTSAVRVTVLGGGSYSGDGQNGFIYSPSHGLGPEPDPDLTIQILQRAFPNCSIKKGWGYEDEKED